MFFKTISLLTIFIIVFVTCYVMIYNYPKIRGTNDDIYTTIGDRGETILKLAQSINPNSSPSFQGISLTNEVNNYSTTIKSSEDQTSNITMTLPDNLGVSGQVLSIESVNDGKAVLGWSDNSETITSLENITSIDETSLETIQNSITTLFELEEIGTLTMGIWNAGTIGVPYGGTGRTTFPNNYLITGNGTDGLVGEEKLTFDGTNLSLLSESNIKIGGDVRDLNNNELIKFATVPSAVNEITVSNNTTTNSPIISSTGGDTNIGLDIKTKGTGIIRNYVNSEVVQEIGPDYIKNLNEVRITDGTNSIGFKSGTPSVNYSLVQPHLPPIGGQVQTFESSSDGLEVYTRWENKNIEERGILSTDYIVDYANMVEDAVTGSGYTFGMLTFGSTPATPNQDSIFFFTNQPVNGILLSRYFGLNTVDINEISDILLDKYVLFGSMSPFEEIILDAGATLNDICYVGLYKCMGIIFDTLVFTRPDSGTNADTYGSAKFKTGVSVNPNNTRIYCRNNGRYYKSTNNNTITVGDTLGDVYLFTYESISNAEVSITTNTNNLNIFNKSSVASGISLYEAHENGVQNISISAPSAITTSHNIILPSAIGSSGQALTVSGVSGTDLSLTYTTLASGGPKFALLKDEKVAGNSGGGGSATANWTIRVLNTEIDPDNIVTLASNQFTLGAGTYSITALGTVFRTDRSFSSLYNVTTASYMSHGPSVGAATNTNEFITHLSHMFTIASSNVFELRTYTTTNQATTGFGVALTNSGATAGLLSTYAYVYITKHS